MPTIKDIAKAAGVSHGTVSNVLTGKGNVSVEKIRLVERIAREMGYVVNESAKTLRSQSAREIAVIMPNITLERYRDFYTYARNYLEENGYEVGLFLTNNIMENDKKAIHKAISDRMAGLICIPSEVGGANPYGKGHGLPMVIAEHAPDLFGGVQVGFDSRRCGAEIGRYAKARGCREALILIDRTYRQEAALLQGIRDSLEAGDTLLHVVNITSADGFLSVVNLLNACPGLDLIITMNTEHADMARAAGRLSGREALPPVLTAASSSIMRGDAFIRYELDYKRAGIQAAKKMLRLVRGKKASSELLPPDGFRHCYTTRIGKGAHQVKMLTLSSPSSRILGELAPLCREQAGIDLKLTILEQQELYDTAATSAGSGFFDIARLDVVWLTEIGRQVFMPLGETGHDFGQILSRMLPDLPDDYTLIDGVPYALPFDPSVLILFYRKDLFGNQIVRRMYYERMREELAVPRSFAAYNKVARFFTRAYNPESPTEFGTTVAMGSFYSVACEFIPRLYEYSSSLPEPADLLRCIGAKEPMEGFFEAYRCSSKKTDTWWRDAAREFAAGQVAMSMMFMNHASDIIKNMETDLQKRVGIASVPGKAPLLGGGITGFMRGAPNLSAACEFMEWVYSDETSKLITYLGGNSPCKEVYSNCEILHRYPWMDVAKNSFSSAVRHFTGGRAVSERYLENVVGLAVRNAALGLSTVEEAVRYIRNTLGD